MTALTVPSSKEHVDGVLAAARRGTRPVFDGVADDATNMPYGVLYDLSGGAFDGPNDDPDRNVDVEFPYQITIVGETAEQVRAMADAVRSSLADGIDVAGRVVVRNVPDGGLGQLQRDDVAGLPVFYLTPRWRLFSTPA